MTVAVQSSKAGPYTGDGKTTEFPYTFPVVDLRTVKVYVDGALQETGVTVTEGKVTLSTAPGKGVPVAILREVPVTQTTDIQNNTAFYPEIMESAFDKLTMICQQLAEELERCVRFPPGMNDDGSLAETIGRLSQLVDEAVRAAADTASIWQQLQEVFEYTKFLGNYITVNATDGNGYLVCDRDSLPCAVTTDTGRVFPLEKDSVLDTGDSYLVDTKPYLAYMNQSTFTGPWMVWRTGGQRGEKGEPGPQGKSLYDIAVDNGYEGSEAEWYTEYGSGADSAISKHNGSALAHENLFNNYIRNTGGKISGSLEVTGEVKVGGKSLPDLVTANPAGTVIAYAGNSAPPGGYLLCNGAAVSRTAYPNLFSAIGTLYGTGDGSTTFNLPNLTDRFIQGSDTAGTVKSAGLPNITGTFTGVYDTSVISQYSGAFSLSHDYRHGFDYQSSATRQGKVTFSAENSSSVYGKSTTVQPPAVTMRYYIKY